MTKFLTALATTSALALASVTAPGPAEARPGVAAIGAIIASDDVNGPTYVYEPVHYRAYGPRYRYYYRYGGSACDRINRDRDLTGTC